MLVGGLVAINFIFPEILGISYNFIIPTDEVIFFRGVAQPPTSNGGFHSHGGTQNRWFTIFYTPTEMDDDWGYPYFRKPPNHQWLIMVNGSMMNND